MTKRIEQPREGLGGNQLLRTLANECRELVRLYDETPLRFDDDLIVDAVRRIQAICPALSRPEDRGTKKES